MSHEQKTGLSEKLPMEDADVVLYRQFFNPDESDLLLQRLIDEIEWKQESIRVPGKLVPLPRLTAWYGDEGTVYKWSGITQHPLAWTPLLRKIKQVVETAAQTTFNSVLLNQYRSGQDSVSWHSDDEPELGPMIASVSFGAVRQFQFKRIDDPRQRLSIDLPDGSLLIMSGETQQHWRHRIPKTSAPLAARINLTFRTIHAVHAIQPSSPTNGLICRSQLPTISYLSYTERSNLRGPRLRK